MAFSDPHDPRQFLRYAKCDANGAIVAMVEVADTAPPPVDDAAAVFVDITAHGAIDVADPVLVESVAPLFDAQMTLARPVLSPPILIAPVSPNGG